MSIEKCLDFQKDGFGKWDDESNPTTGADMYQFVDNQNNVVKNLASLLWQPETRYDIGAGVHSPALPKGTIARCITAGESSTSEPNWGNAGSTATDGTVKWLIENEVKSKNDAEIDSKIAMANHYLKRNTAYSIGDIAYSPNLPSWAYLECTTAGTTGASEPDFSSVKSGG